MTHSVYANGVVAIAADNAYGTETVALKTATKAVKAKLAKPASATKATA